MIRSLLLWFIRWMDRRIAKFSAIAESDAAPWTVGAALVDRAESVRWKEWAERRLEELK